MTAPRAFLIPTDWGQRPLGRLELIEDGPYQIAAAASAMTAPRELISGTPFTMGGTVDRERDYIGCRQGWVNIAGFWWPGGTATMIARHAKLVTYSNLTSYQFCGTFTNDMGVRIATTNFWMDNSTTGSFGVVGGAVCATAVFDPRIQPYFVAKSLQNTRADMACYNSNGRLLKSFARTGISTQTISAQKVTSNYFNGISSGAHRNGALTEMVLIVGGMTADDMHAVVSQFYGLFFRPLVERTFFIPAPAAGGGVTITGVISESVAATVAPTTTSGSLNITPPTDSAVTDGVAPTVVQGSLNITPPQDSAVTEGVAPTTVLGSVSVTPTADSVVAETMAPTVVLGSMNITPAQGVGVVATVDPTVTLGALAITPNALAAIAAVIDPSVVLGSMNVTPTSTSAVTDKANPTVQVGGILITNPIAFAIPEVANPSVAYGSIVVAGAVADAIAALLDPTVSSGGITVAGAVAEAVASIVAPGVILGSLVLVPTNVASVVQVSGPTVQYGSLVVTPAVGHVICVSLIGGVTVGDTSLFGGLSGAIDIVYMKGVITLNPLTGTVTAEPALKAKVTLN